MENLTRHEIFPLVSWNHSNISNISKVRCQNKFLLRENELKLKVYNETDHGLAGLQQAAEVALLPGLYSNVDSGENCKFSLLYRFVKKDFFGVTYYGFIIGKHFPYYEVKCLQLLVMF